MALSNEAVKEIVAHCRNHVIKHGYFEEGEIASYTNHILGMVDKHNDDDMWWILDWIDQMPVIKREE